jgi:hypothetical protein
MVSQSSLRVGFATNLNHASIYIYKHEMLYLSNLLIFCEFRTKNLALCFGAKVKMHGIRRNQSGWKPFCCKIDPCSFWWYLLSPCRVGLLQRMSGVCFSGTFGVFGESPILSILFWILLQHSCFTSKFQWDPLPWPLGKHCI